MDKGLHKLFKAVVNDISETLPVLGEFVSDLSYFITEPINFPELTRLSEDTKKPWLKETLKEIKNLISNQTFLVQDTEKVEPVTPCMDVYKAKNQSGVSIDKLKMIIVVWGDLHIKELFGDTWLPTASMMTLKWTIDMWVINSVSDK